MDSVCGILGVDLQETVPQRLPLDTVVQLWRLCAERSNDPLFGLHFGQQVRPGTFHVVGYTLMSCATLGEALEKLSRYQKLVSEGGRVAVKKEGESLWLTYSPQPDTVGFIDHQIDAVMSAVITFTRWMCGRNVKPLEVFFAHGEPAQTEAYREFFSSTIHFNCAFNGMKLSGEVLDWPLVDADSELRRLHEGKALADLRDLEQEASTARQVIYLLRASGQPLMVTRARIAETLNMGERTLQRKLEQEGSPFRSLVDKVASELVCQWLTETDASLQSIAEQLGFSDASALHRAFLRWKGVAPGLWRKQYSRHDQGGRT
ncbi:AraC family transcriptional regulator [Marinobacteraceae bacterium S3BR75-40.1]